MGALADLTAFARRRFERVAAVRAGKERVVLVLCHDTDHTVRPYQVLRLLPLREPGRLPPLRPLDLLHLPQAPTAAYNHDRMADFPGELEEWAERPLALRGRQHGPAANANACALDGRSLVDGGGQRDTVVAVRAGQRSWSRVEVVVGSRLDGPGRLAPSPSTLKGVRS